jgi:hypothetical protein
MISIDGLTVEFGGTTLLAVWGASSFWSIGELFEQRKRVEKGWFPKRPEKKER